MVAIIYVQGLLLLKANPAAAVDCLLTVSVLSSPVMTCDVLLNYLLPLTSSINYFKWTSLK